MTTHLHDEEVDVAVVLAEADAVDTEHLGEDGRFLRERRASVTETETREGEKAVERLGRERRPCTGSKPERSEQRPPFRASKAV